MENTPPADDPRRGKLSDDYIAKIRACAAHPVVIPPPPGPPIPKFPVQRFRSHAEMNAWKEALIRQIAARMRG